jgi:hypothetical protein
MLLPLQKKNFGRPYWQIADKFKVRIGAYIVILAAGRASGAQKRLMNARHRGDWRIGSFWHFADKPTAREFVGYWTAGSTD